MIKRTAKYTIIILIIILGIITFTCNKYSSSHAVEPINIGILHSQSGLLAYADILTKEIVAFTIDEINAQGGVLGRPLQAIFTDGKSDSDIYAKETERLIAKEKVPVIFGGGLSIIRKKIKPIVEKYNNLFFYTWRNEGLEISDNIIYIGGTPNQQIIPGIWWSINNLGNKFFLLGSENIYSRITHEIMKDHILSLGGQVIGESFIPMNSIDVKEIVEKIKRSHANIILHTVMGLDTNKEFFKELAIQKIFVEQIPVMSFSLSEPDLIQLNLNQVEGNFATWNYMQSDVTAWDTNEQFVKKFKEKFGSQSAIGDPMESLYFAIKLWVKAVNKVKSTDTEKVLKALKGESIYVPEETVYIDKKNNHAWRSVIIGRVKNDGQFMQVWESTLPIEPSPYPITRSKETWEQLVNSFSNYEGKY